MAQSAETPQPPSKMTMALKAFGVAVAVWAWLMSWVNMIFFGYKVFFGNDAGSGVEYRVSFYTLLVGLVMTNVLGYREFAAQGRRKEALLAAIDMDLPYITAKSGRSILSTDSCLDWDKLILRQAVWRSVPLAMVSLFLASRALLEMPLCQLAVVTKWFEIGIQLDDYAQGEVYKKFDDWTQFQSIKYMQDVVSDQTRDTFRALIHAYLPLNNTFWEAGECQKSDWRASTSQGERGINFRLEVPQSRVGGLIGDGDLMATTVILGRTFRQRLLLHGSSLLSFVRAAVVRAAEVKKGKAAKHAAGLLMGGVTWERVVDAAFEPNAQASESYSDGRLYPVQARDGWMMDLCKAAFLLLASCNPLVKAVAHARSVRKFSHYLALAAHTAIDLWMLLAAVLLCSGATGARALDHSVTDCMDRIIQSVTKRLGSEEGKSVMDYALDECASSSWRGGHCKTTYDKMYDLARNGELLVSVKDAVDEVTRGLGRLSVPPLHLLLLGVGLAAFSWMSKSIATSALPKSVVWSQTASVSLGIAGPLHLLAFVAEKDVKKTLDATMCMVASRSMILTIALFVAWFGTKPELFMALTFNREIYRSHLVLAWMGLLIAHFMTAFFALDSLREAHRCQRKKEAAAGDVEKLAAQGPEAPIIAVDQPRRASRAPPPPRRPSMYGTIPAALPGVNSHATSPGLSGATPAAPALPPSSEDRARQAASEQRPSMRSTTGSRRPSGVPPPPRPPVRRPSQAT